MFIGKLCVMYALTARIRQHMDEHNPRTYSEGKKWFIVILALNLLMWANAISAMAAPAIENISSDLHVSTAAGRVIQAIYLYGVAVGAVILTPLSEGAWVGNLYNERHAICMWLIPTPLLFLPQTTAGYLHTSFPLHCWASFKSLAP